MGADEAFQRDPACPDPPRLNARYSGAWYFCWLIERRDTPDPQWWGVNGFVTNAHDALWFARRSDADTFAGEMAVDVVVNEHGFALGEG